MSLKSVIQIIILIIIFIILGGVYFKYFSQDKIIIDESIQKSEQESKNSKEIVQNIFVHKVVQSMLFSQEVLSISFL